MIQELPTYLELMLPVLQVVDRLGGSATGRQIKEAVVETLEPSEDLLVKRLHNMSPKGFEQFVLLFAAGLRP